jgi:hypothetical protein
MSTTQFHIRSPRGNILAVFEDGSVPGSAEGKAKAHASKCLNSRLVRVTITEEDITNEEDHPGLPIAA